jgi:hypothetical protein
MALLKNKAQKDKVEEKIENSIEESTNPDIEIKVQSTSKESSKALLKKLMEEETKIVKGKFRNYECPGASHKICVKKYKEIPKYEQVLEDGKTYEIPLYVARHLNGVDATAKAIGGKVHSCEYPTHGFKWDNDSNGPKSQLDGGMVVPLIVPQKWNRRFGFESLEFNVE